MYFIDQLHESNLDLLMEPKSLLSLEVEIMRKWSLVSESIELRPSTCDDG